MSVHYWLSIGPRFNLLPFPLVPKYPGIVLPGCAKSFHLCTVSWLQGPKADDRCQQDEKRSDSSREKISKHNPFCLSL